MIPPPHSIAALLERAHALSELSLQELARRHQVQTTHLHKGWAGQLLEVALGAAAQSRPEPDFIELGVELKTLPVNRQGTPCESTFVCAIPALPDSQWKGSRVQRKLATVLWIPILTEKGVSLLQRRISLPLLWSPTVAEEKLLREDWEELTELILLGKAAALTAHHGQVLQVRPKAAHSRVLRHGIDSEGESHFIVPRGFYLRTQFTANIIRQHYLL